MASIDHVKSLSDLPGFDRLSEVARRHDEPMALRGSALRRLVVRLMRGQTLDYLLPALCTPPPSDLDLLFDTEDSDTIGLLLGEMRDTSPILQGVRLEASSLPRVQGLREELGAHLACPVFGLALPALAEEGFSDPSDRGLQELAEGVLTFTLSDQARKEPGLLEDPVLFHLYGSCLSYLKATGEHDAYRADDDGLAMAREFLQRTVPTIAMLIDGELNPGEEGDYFHKRLRALAYSLRTIMTAEEFEAIAPFLPEDIAAPYLATRADAPLFRFASASVVVPNDDWSAFDAADLEEAVELSHSRPLAKSPLFAVPDTDEREGVGLECHIPRTGALEGAIGHDLSALLKLTLDDGTGPHELWIPTLCHWDQGEHATNLRVPMDGTLELVHRVQEQVPGVDAEFQIFLLEAAP